MNRKAVISAILALALGAGMSVGASAYNPMAAMEDISRNAVATAISEGKIPADATIFDCAYDFSNVGNTSNVPLDDFFWHDQLPTDSVRLKTIFTDTWNESLTYDVMYKTSGKGGYKALAENLTSKQNHTLDCSPAAPGQEKGALPKTGW